MKATRPLTPLRVLLVEDSQDDAELIVLHLKKEGFKVDWRRVQTELDYSVALLADYDLILSDWALPQFSGLKALQLVRERGLEIPFIIVSGRIGEDAAVAALRQGAYDYLLKDHPERLGQAVRNALEQAKSHAERKLAEVALTKRNQEINFLYEAGQQLSRTLDLDSLYTTLYQFLSKMMDCTGLFISSYESAQKLIRCQFAMGDDKRLDVRNFPAIPLEPKGQGTQSQVIRSRNAMIIDDYQAMVRSANSLYFIGDDSAVVERENLPEDQDVTRSAIVLPVLLKKRVVGVVQIFSYRLSAYSEDHLKIAESLVAQLAVASNNAALYQQAQMEIAERKRAEKALEKLAEELRAAYDATLQGWSNALELRERETAGHSRRVVEVTLQLARILGISEEEIPHIQRGALLHDIGKIGIPDAILLKKGPLDADEWDIIRQHPVYALRLLENVPYLEPALTIPYRHHERWDGSGYPDGLKGEDIPLPARIFAVVDVWDALSYDRPYRSAWDEKKVFTYLDEQSGKQFDPHVVATFLQLMK